MMRPMVVASLVVLAVLPAATGAVRADGFAQGEPPVSYGPPPWRAPHRRYAAPPRYRHHPPAAYGYATPAGEGLYYGYLPRILNLPIYDAPSEGPSPQL